MSKDRERLYCPMQLACCQGRAPRRVLAGSEYVCTVNATSEVPLQPEPPPGSRSMSSELCLQTSVHATIAPMFVRDWVHS
jgi:hypothetical protein